VLAENECIDRAGRNLQARGKLLAQATGVEQGASPHHARCGQSRATERDQCHQIDRVCGDEDDPAKATVYELANALRDDRGASRRDGNSRLCTLSCRPRGDHGDRGRRRIRIAARPDASGSGKRIGVAKVSGFRRCQCSVVIDQHDLAEQGSQHQSVSGRRADVAGADNCDTLASVVEKIVAHCATRPPHPDQSPLSGGVAAGDPAAPRAFARDEQSSGHRAFRAAP